MTAVDDPPRSPASDMSAASARAGLCPRCGGPIATSEPVAKAAAGSPLSAAESPLAAARVAQGSRAGLLTLLLLCAPSAIFAGIALALLADERWVGGFVLVALALVSAAFLLAAVDREPDAPLAHQALAVAARAQSKARMACISLAAWSSAVRALVRARRRQQRLYAARKDRLAALAEAILRGDRAHAARLKAETRDLGEEMRAREREASAAIDSARAQIEHERAARAGAVGAGY